MVECGYLERERERERRFDTLLSLLLSQVG